MFETITNVLTTAWTFCFGYNRYGYETSTVLTLDEDAHPVKMYISDPDDARGKYTVHHSVDGTMESISINVHPSLRSVDTPEEFIASITLTEIHELAHYALVHDGVSEAQFVESGPGHTKRWDPFIVENAINHVSAYSFNINYE